MHQVFYLFKTSKIHNFDFLAFVCNAGAAGKYEVRHSGAYVAHVRVNFEYNGVWHSYETDDYTSGMTRVLEIPKGATKNQIIVKNAVFIGMNYSCFCSLEFNNQILI